MKGVYLVKKNFTNLKKLEDFSKQELKELVLVNAYKLAMLKSQVESISEILIKHKLTTYEELWKKTNKNFKDIKL